MTSGTLPLSRQEIEKIVLEHEADVALDFRRCDAAACVLEVGILISQDLRQNSAAVAPFIEELIQNAGVRVLRDEAGAEQFDAHALDFFDEAGIVEEPPAAEDHEVAEFAGGDAQLVLIFSGEHGYEEFVFGEFAAEVDDGADVGLGGSVTAVAEFGVYAHARADHHGEGEASLGTDGVDDFFEDGLPSFFDWVGTGGIAEFRWETDSEVNRLLAVDPFAKEAADFLDGGGGDFFSDFVTPLGEFLGSGGPCAKKRVDAQDGGESGIAGDRRILEPAVSLVVVEDRIGHRD